MYEPKMITVNTKAYFDVDHASELVTHFSVTGSLVYVDFTPTKW